MADKTVVVAPSGGDWTSVNAALVFEFGDTPDLVAASRILTIQIEDRTGTWSSPDVTNITALNGFTTNSTSYIHIKILEDEDAQHDGTSFKTNGYVLAPTGSSHCIVLDQENTIIEGLPIHLKDNPTNSSEGIRCDTGSDDSTIDKCIIWHESNDTDADGIYLWNSNSHVDGHTINVNNTIIYGFTRAGINHQCYVNNSDTSNMNIRNCIIFDCGNSGEGESAAIHNREPTNVTTNTTVYNTIGCGTDHSNTDFFNSNGTPNWIGNYNICSSTTGDMPGGNSISTSPNDPTDSTTPGAGDWISFVDITSAITAWNLHMLDDDDNSCLDAGNASDNPPSPFQKDIDYETRNSPPNIGADDFPSGAPPGEYVFRATIF